MADKLINELTLLPSGDVEGADLCEIQEADQNVTKKITVTVLNELEKAERVAQDNVIEASVGLSAAGAYVPPVGSNYLDASTDVMDALDILDGAIGSNLVVTEAVNINAANLNNAGVAPFEIIAAPGAGYYIEVVSVSCSLDYDSVALECGAQKFVLEYDTSANHFVEWANAFIEGAADDVAKGTWTSEVDIPVNKKVQATFDGAANPTAGDTRVTINITYIIWDI